MTVFTRYPNCTRNNTNVSNGHYSDHSNGLPYDRQAKTPHCHHIYQTAIPSKQYQTSETTIRPITYSRSVITRSPFSTARVNCFTSYNAFIPITFRHVTDRSDPSVPLLGRLDILRRTSRCPYREMVIQQCQGHCGHRR